MNRETLQQFTKEIQISMRGYTKNPYSIELQNTQEVDEFLCSFKLPKSSQEEINNLNRAVTEEEVDSYEMPSG